MARVKGAMMTRKRRKKTLKLAKGYWGAKSRHFKMAKQAVMSPAIMHISVVSREREISVVFGLLVFRLPARLTAQIIQLS